MAGPTQNTHPMEELVMTTPNTAKVQRTPNGMLLGACIALSAKDIAFVDSTVEFLEIHRKHSEDGIVLEIKSTEP